ncbi:hypothetical protein Tco_0750349 [Tanacetum coccineum]|uniref:Uncharacterized protein n=1 Tax=Tanacetum coccineum TaxID=301880 RepID=A0ABQ4Z479_9ASTR
MISIRKGRISDTYIFAQSTLSVYNHQKVSLQLENIAEAYEISSVVVGPTIHLPWTNISAPAHQDQGATHGVISTDGNAMPQAPSQVPFPMGINVRSRMSKKQNISREENNGERSLDTGNGKVFSYRDSSSGSTKDLE